MTGPKVGADMPPFSHLASTSPAEILNDKYFARPSHQSQRVITFDCAAASNNPVINH